MLILFSYVCSNVYHQFPRALQEKLQRSSRPFLTCSVHCRICLPSQKFVWTRNVFWERRDWRFSASISAVIKKRSSLQRKVDQTIAHMSKSNVIPLVQGIMESSIGGAASVVRNFDMLILHPSLRKMLMYASYDFCLGHVTPIRTRV